MAKKQEMREVTIYYCDVCGHETDLPYYGVDDNGYGSCCYDKMHKSKRYLKEVNKIRGGIGMMQIDATFENLKNHIE